MFVGATERHGRIKPIEKEFAVREACQVVVYRIVQQPFFGDLAVGDVREGADHAKDFAVCADHRSCAKFEPEVMPVLRAQPEFLDDAAAALLKHAVECHLEAVAIGGVQEFEPSGGRGLEHAALQAKGLLGFVARVDKITRDVPVPHDVACAGEGERAALEVVDDAFSADACERVLHDREADQHDDQLKAAE